MTSRVQKIGLIGGLSWVSTAAYYRRLNELAQEHLGGVASARIALESVNRQDYVDAVIERSDEGAACEQIREAARALERAGADFLVIACNDVHRFVPDIVPSVAIPFLHIANVTAEAACAAGCRTIGLIGVRKTMEGEFYPNAFDSYGLRTLVPDGAERAFVHDTIYSELTQNVFADRTRAGYLRVIDALAERGADSVALACTEIPLLIRPGDAAVPTFDTTELHCRAALDRALGPLGNER